MFLKTSEDDKELKKALKNLLGFLPGHLQFYITAFTHRSSNEDLVSNNERLEFLGDAYIGSIVGEYLFKKYPNRDEGFLTEMRSKIVSRNSLNDIALKMGLQKLIRFNKNDKMLRRSNIFGNCLEALVGAIYLDKGFEKTRKFILKNMLYNYIDIDDLEITDFNFKNKLYNWAQINSHVLDFVTLGESNEAGRRVFTVGIEIDGELFIKATGYNKKAAGQTAAQKALEQLDITTEE
ncbi:MAG: ribonuclease III [Bacteroidetes bacterium 43-16]|nr:MAG: ribonuclease III [Bacteroidetes bacterium 43-16]